MIQAHGGNIKYLRQELNLSEEEMIDFSANINPLGMPELFVQVIRDNLKVVEHYPDYTYEALKENLARYYSVKKEFLSVTNGAEEAIRMIMSVLPKHIILIQPTFSEYEKAAIAWGKEIIHFQLMSDNNFRLDFQELVDYIEEIILGNQENYRAAVFLCNPNNPTGVLYTQEEMIFLARELQKLGALLVLDESFMDFVEDRQSYSMVKIQNDFQNVIIIQSLTKFYAMPGLRLGMVTFPQLEMKEKFDLMVGTWSINSFADLCGQNIVNLDDFCDSTINYYQAERNKLTTFLNQLPEFKVYSPAVNFIFFQTSITNFMDKMLNKGIVVRSCANFRGLDDSYFRIAVRTTEENIQIMNKIQSLISEE